MKKRFKALEMEIVFFETEDLITASVEGTGSSNFVTDKKYNLFW